MVNQLHFCLASGNMRLHSSMCFCHVWTNSASKVAYFYLSTMLIIEIAYSTWTPKFCSNSAQTGMQQCPGMPSPIKGLLEPAHSLYVTIFIALLYPVNVSQKVKEKTVRNRNGLFQIVLPDAMLTP